VRLHNKIRHVRRLSMAFCGRDRIVVVKRNKNVISRMKKIEISLFGNGMDMVDLMNSLKCKK